MQDSKDSNQGSTPKSNWEHAMPWIILAVASALLAVLQLWASKAISIWMPLEGYAFGENVARGFHAVLILLCTTFAGFGFLARSKQKSYPRLLALAGGMLAIIHALYAHYLLLPHLMLAAGAVPYRFPAKIQSVLNSSRVIELVSILPYQEPGQVVTTIGTFHEYRLLGRLKITEPTQAEELKRQVFEDMANPGRTPALCFWPRHALVFEGPAGKVELLICYECQKTVAHVNGKRHEVGMTGHSKPLLNRLLQEAGIPLAPESSEP